MAQICVQLDGLPLAIELAAARLRLLSLTALHQKLEHQPGQKDEPGRLGLLTGGPRDAPPHQQSLRRAIESSYMLLGDDEQILFRKLGSFFGPFTFEAAEAVTGASLDSLETVLNQSLIRREPRGLARQDESVRFSMLASIREYAQESMVAHNELEGMSLKHAIYFMDMINATHPESAGPNEEIWANRMGTWLDDIRGALRWAIQSGKTEIALKTLSPLGPFWKHRRFVEGSRWLAKRSPGPPKCLTRYAQEHCK